MKLETIKKDKKKNIIMGSMIVLSVAAGITLTTTRAKYRNVQSLKLANGVVDYKAPDLKLAIKVSEDGENYTSRTDIPTSGYTFNTEKSKCRIPTSTQTGENAPIAEGVTIEYTDGKINVLGVTQQDTRCYVYFDKVKGQTSSTIIAAIENSTSYKGETKPTFGIIATGPETEANNGIYKVTDGMYSGNSYYWRGAATTNHVIFDSKCWRIVRINGDKSIRLIYNGTPSGNTCSGNGNSETVIMGSSNAEKYYATSDGKVNRSYYVGWTYGSSQRTTSGTASNAKTQTEKWYNNNISAASKTKIDTAGKFCNDRNVGTAPSSWSGTWSTTWSGNGGQFAYAGAKRIYEDRTPTLCCPSGDTYSLSVGAITADEVMLAGGKDEKNTSYYLYSDESYWTMTPSYWNGAQEQAIVFIVQRDGYLYNYWVDDTLGLRPVINLRSDVTFNAGSNGTSSNPYIVQ